MDGVHLMDLGKASNDLYRHHLRMAPVRIELELTEACNIACRFCYNSGERAFTDKLTAMRILHLLAGQGVLEIILTGGEPLLHPDFDLIAREAGSLFPHVLLQTNGTLLTEEKMVVLTESGFLGLNISLHGGPDTHDYLTQHQGSHARALRSVKRALKSPLVTWVNLVLTNQNYGEIGAHLRFLSEVGVRNFTFTRFTPTGSGRAATLALSLEQLETATRRIQEFRDSNQGSTVLLANAVPRCALPEDLREFAEPCSYGVDRFYVNVRGDLMICGMSRVPLGNVLNATLREIKAASSAFQQTCGYVGLPQKCQLCSSVTACRGGCRAAALATSGRLDGMDPLAAWSDSRE
jgi:radical SAM protein with 4Fe4S-binding SPASM domain